MSSKTTDLTIPEMHGILAEEEVGVLCMSDGEQPYAVPVSYAWMDGKIVFHSAARGRKLDVLRNNPRVSFVVYRSPNRTTPHAEGKCDFRFESVLISGQARIVGQPAEQLSLLRCFKQHWYGRLGLDRESDPVTEQAAAKCGCVEITVQSLTGRRRAAGQ